MLTLEELRKYFPTQVGELEMEYEQLMSRKKTPKTIYKFKVLGKVYDEDVFTKNYVTFFNDIHKILSFEQIGECVADGIISTNGNEFRKSHNIGGNFYVNTNNSTERKIKMIDKICEQFGISKKVIEHIEGGEVFV